ncbi:MAG TPA: SDR family oxidoreductase [Hyphomicrobiaceae bacterium]|jgi:nucleoside-diphosphate-sugar epimerase|nr:SDR family oxidoreductase [Hyphomicrobiaceae bacterium]
MRLFCFGCGYTAEALLRRLAPREMTFAGTRSRLPEAAPVLPGLALVAYAGDSAVAAVRQALQDTTHLLVSIPPDLEGDVVLRHFRDELAALPRLSWVGYLSTVGVYGDCQGAWVDETSPTRPTNERSLRRVQAERAWLSFGDSTSRRVEIFRLAGIYGPGRSVIDNLRSGTARRIVKAGQIFNRIHVDDIARTLVAAIDREAGHRIYNVSDDEPAPPQDVVAYAAEMLGVPMPPEVPYAEAELSGLAASFWSESRRVRNDRIRRDLGVELLYPTFREGLRALATV